MNSPMEQLNELIQQTKMLLNQARHEVLKTYYNAVLTALERLQKHEKTPPKKAKASDPAAEPGKFQEFVSAYFEFHQRVATVKPMWTGAQGNTMKEIIAYLKDNTPDKTEDSALAGWQFILQHWDRLSNFLKNQITLHAIKRNLPEIIATLKNGATTQQKNAGAAAKFRQRYSGRSAGTDHKGDQ